jgi:hypothetical protein
LDFLKKHYEKIILAVFLLAFVFLLIYLIELSKSTRTITSSDLEIPPINPSYTPNDFSHKKYQTNYIFTNNCIWKKSVARSDKDKIYTDLLIPFKCARCPFGFKVIPRYYFLGPIDNPRKCPLCAKALPRPVVVDPGGGGISGGMDRDNDGIPNVTEIKLGLDPDNPDDAFYDMDNDGFPNVYEYQKGKNIKKSKSHPPLHERLHLIEFRETLLPFQLKLVNTNGKKDPKDWDIQINETIKGKIKTRFKYLDSRMTLDKTTYKITKIDAKHEEKRRGGTIVKVDNSKVYLESEDGKYTITMQVGKNVYSPKPKAIVEDLATEKMYHVGVGDSIVMYLKTKASISKRTGKRLRRKTTKYKVFKVDRQKKQVIIVDKKLKKYILTAKALVPRIKQKEENINEYRADPGSNPGMPPDLMDAPPGGDPRRRTSTKRRKRRNF